MELINRGLIGYCSNSLYNVIKYTKIHETGISDHKMIVCEFSEHNECKNNKKTKLWKLNEEILELGYVVESIKNICHNIESIKNAHKNGNTWYDKFIKQIISLLKKAGRESNELKKEKLNWCYTQLSKLNNEFDVTDELMKKKAEIRRTIDEHYETIKKGNEKRVRDEREKFIKQPTKVLLEQEIKNSKSCLINEYECLDGTKTTDEQKIKNEIYDFYNEITGKEQQLVECEFQIKPLNVTQTIFDFINRPITFNEANRVVKDMKEAAPGPNGLTIGFYKSFFEFFGHH